MTSSIAGIVRWCGPALHRVEVRGAGVCATVRLRLPSMASGWRGFSARFTALLTIGPGKMTGFGKWQPICEGSRRRLVHALGAQLTILDLVILPNSVDL